MRINLKVSYKLPWDTDDREYLQDAWIDLDDDPIYEDDYPDAPIRFWIRETHLDRFPVFGNLRLKNNIEEDVRVSNGWVDTRFDRIDLEDHPRYGCLEDVEDVFNRVVKSLQSLEFVCDYISSDD